MEHRPLKPILPEDIHLYLHKFRWLILLFNRLSALHIQSLPSRKSFSALRLKQLEFVEGYPKILHRVDQQKAEKINFIWVNIFLRKKPYRAQVEWTHFWGKAWIRAIFPRSLIVLLSENIIENFNENFFSFTLNLITGNVLIVSFFSSESFSSPIT